MPTDDDVTLADSIGAAFDTASSSSDTEEPGGDPPDTPVVDTAGDPPVIEGGETEKVRDALGRFVPKVTDAAPPEGAAPPNGHLPPADGLPTQPAAIQAVPAPISWTPAARETWASLPPAAQAEVMRREQEIERGISENASARSIARQFSEAVSPYIARMQMQGVSPPQAISNLLATEMTLGQGTALQKAQTVARLVKAYSVDIEALDSALAGEAPPQGLAIDAQVQQLVAQQMAPMQQFMAQAEQYRQQKVEQAGQEISQGLDAFANDGKHEFFGDVKGLMADLIDVATTNKFPITMQEAYDRAVFLHPQTKGVMEARQRATVAAGLTGAAQRARRAAVSVTGSPTLGSPDDGAEPATLRDAVIASMDRNARV